MNITSLKIRILLGNNESWSLELRTAVYIFKTDITYTTTIIIRTTKR